MGHYSTIFESSNYFNPRTRNAEFSVKVIAFSIVRGKFGDGVQTVQAGEGEFVAFRWWRDEEPNPYR